jgi:hypothetical protein
MIRKSVFFYLTLLFLLGCTNSNQRLILGSQRHGLNKVIKSTSADDEDQTVTIKSWVNKSEVSPNFPDNNVIKEESTGEIPAQISETSKTVIRDEPNKISDKIPSLQKRKKVVEHALQNKVNRKSRQEQGGGFLSNPLVVLIITFGAVFIGLFYAIYWIIFIYSQYQNYEEFSEETGCYIATMAYGNYDHPKVQTLRNFRDQFLDKRAWGKKFIRWYYQNSPGFTRFYANNSIVHFYMRQYLNVFVFLIRPFFKGQPVR